MEQITFVMSFCIIYVPFIVSNFWTELYLSKCPNYLSCLSLHSDVEFFRLYGFLGVIFFFHRALILYSTAVYGSCCQAEVCCIYSVWDWFFSSLGGQTFTGAQSAQNIAQNMSKGLRCYTMNFHLIIPLFWSFNG